MLNSWLRRLTRSRQILVPIHIPARKSGIASRRIEPLPASAADCPELLVPLTFEPDVIACPTAKPGDRVGPLADLSQPGHGRTIRVFSPADAEVAGLASADTEYACDLPAVRLRLSAEAVWPPAMPSPALHEMAPKPAPRDTGATRAPADPGGVRGALAELAQPEDLPATLDELGLLTSRAGGPEPLGQLLRRASGRTNLLVINAIQSEPQLASHRRLTIEALGAIVAGARAMMTYLALRRATLLVSATHGLPLGTLRRLRRFGIRTVPVRTRFPGSDNSIVLRRLLGRPAPSGDDGLSSDCLVLPVDTVWRAGLALLHRRPVPFQMVTVAGDCLLPASQRVYLLPIGLTIAGLVQCLRRQNRLPREPKVILLGGPLTGTAITDPSRTVITQTTQAVLLMSRKPPLRTSGCIRCGWCISGCPVGIHPIAVLDALEVEPPRVPAHLAVDRCIGCGICSAICPSHLPLAQAARTARMRFGRQ